MDLPKEVIEEIIKSILKRRAIRHPTIYENFDFDSNVKEMSNLIEVNGDELGFIYKLNDAIIDLEFVLNGKKHPSGNYPGIRIPKVSHETKREQ